MLEILLGLFINMPFIQVKRWFNYFLEILAIPKLERGNYVKGYELDH